MATTSIPIPQGNTGRKETTPKLPSLLKLHIAALQIRLCELYDLPLERVQPISSNDRMQLSQKVTELVNGNRIKLPQIFMRFASVASGMEDAGNGYNAVQLYRNGMAVAPDDMDASSLRIHPIPVTLEFEIVYQCDQFEDTLNFAERWLSGGMRNALNSTITYAGSFVDIKAVQSGRIDLPELDKSIDMPNYYEISTSVQLRGYSVSNHRQDVDVEPTLHQMQVGASVDSMEIDPDYLNTAFQLLGKTL